MKPPIPLTPIPTRQIALVMKINPKVAYLTQTLVLLKHSQMLKKEIHLYLGVLKIEMVNNKISKPPKKFKFLSSSFGLSVMKVS